MKWIGLATIRRAGGSRSLRAMDDMAAEQLVRRTASTRWQTQHVAHWFHHLLAPYAKGHYSFNPCLPAEQPRTLHPTAFAVLVRGVSGHHATTVLRVYQYVPPAMPSSSTTAPPHKNVQYCIVKRTPNVLRCVERRIGPNLRRPSK